MIKLFDILREGNIISAKYTAVGYNGDGFIRVDIESEKSVEIVKPEGDAGHPWFAHLAKKRLLQIKDMNPIPTHTAISCY